MEYSADYCHLDHCCIYMEPECKIFVQVDTQIFGSLDFTCSDHLAGSFRCCQYFGDWIKQQQFSVRWVWDAIFGTIGEPRMSSFVGGW